MFSTILAWFTGGWSKILPWVLGILGVVGAAFSLRQSGKNAAYAEVAQKEIKQDDKAIEVNQYVSTLSDSDVDNLLRKQFSAN